MSSPDTLLWDDNPSQVDLLGFVDVAAPVLAALANERLDPVCVGVFGPWGAGKTTVIEMIKRSLEDDDSVADQINSPGLIIQDPHSRPQLF